MPDAGQKNSLTKALSIVGFHSHPPGQFMNEE